MRVKSLIDGRAFLYEIVKIYSNQGSRIARVPPGLRICVSRIVFGSKLSTDWNRRQGFHNVDQLSRRKRLGEIGVGAGAGEHTFQSMTLSGMKAAARWRVWLM